MPVMTIIAMADTGNHTGNGTWPTLEVASKIFDLSSFVLIGALVVGAVATILIVWMGIVKEHHWDVHRLAAAERIAELDNETARLRAQNALTLDSLLAANRVGRDNALATEANRATTEAMAVAQGLLKREAASEATRALYIGSTVEPFAGKQFDALVTSISIDLGALLGSLRASLNKAGWIEIKQSDPTAGLGLLSMDRGGGPALVRIEVDASKDPELLDAAETLASALNAAGIEATVNPKAETDAANVNMIHILVGPKP